MARTKVVRGICTVSGCGQAHKAAGFCASHYQRHKRGVSPHVELRRRDRNPPERCIDPGCTEPVKAKGLCQMHYARLLKHGFTRFRDRKKPAKPCTYPGCQNHLYANGLCNQHYLRKRVGAQKYGMTLEEIIAMQERQGSVCAICKGVPDSKNAASGKVTDFSIDHCHKTGKVRGLLCNRCNRAIGMFADDPSLIRAAAAYLDIHLEAELSLD